jgi:hypothetical protein
LSVHEHGSGFSHAIRQAYERSKGAKGSADADRRWGVSAWVALLLSFGGMATIVWCLVLGWYAVQVARMLIAWIVA